MRLRGWLYWLARLLGDIEAVSRGPAAVGRRIVRKSIIRELLRLFRINS